MPKRIRLGDVFEISTREGLAYGQMTQKRKEWGALIRVLPGFFSSRPKDLSGIMQQESIFVAFFPLQAAVSQGIFEIVGNERVPPLASEFPLFRNAGFVDREGKAHDWWLWDGEREWRIERLSKEQRRLPILEVVNDTLLIERIEEGWRPEKNIH